jgi:hypothetical protein
MENRSVQELFCERLSCSSKEYENRAFRVLLYGHAKFIAPALRRLRPDFFDEDFRFIRDLGAASDLREANASAADFQDRNGARRSFCRSRLRIRVSGLKAIHLAHELFEQAH